MPAAPPEAPAPNRASSARQRNWKWRWLINLSGICLVALFAVQAVFLQQLLIAGRLHVPRPLLQIVSGFGQHAEFVHSIEHANFNTRGQVLLRGIELRERASDYTVLAISSVTFHPGKSSFLKNARLEVVGGELRNHSAASSNPVFSNIHGEFRNDGETWQITHLGAQHRLAYITLAGYLPSTKARRPAPGVGLADTAIQIFQTIEDITSPLQRATEARIHATFIPAIDDPQALEIEARLDAFRIDTRFASFHETRSRVRLRLSSTFQPELAQIAATMRELRSPWFTVRTDTLQLDAQFRGPHALNPGFSVDLAIERGVYRLEEIAHTTAHLSGNDLRDLHYSLTSIIRGPTRLGIDGKIDVLNRSTSGTLVGRIDPALLLEHPAIAPLTPRLPSITFASIPYLNASFSLGENFQFNEARLRLRSSGIALNAVRVDRVDTTLTSDGETVEIDHLSLGRDDLHGNARAFYNAQTGDYGFELVGMVDPVEIGPLIGTWWDSIFNNFDFSAQKASLADFVILGNHTQQRPDYFFGSVVGNQISYYGIELQSGGLKVRGTPTYVELYDLDATTTEGERVSGHLEWLLEPETGLGPRTIFIDLDATLRPERIAPIIPAPAAARWIGAFETTVAPTIQVRARFHNREHGPAPAPDWLILNGQSDDPLTLEGVPIDALQFQFFNIGNNSYLRHGRIKIAHGDAHLAFNRIANTQSDDLPAQIHLLFAIEDANRDQAIEIVRDYLAHTQTDHTETSPSAEPPATNQSPEATFNLDLHLEGSEGDLLAFNGYGKIVLIDPRLATIPILGPISRILERAPIDFTNLSLNQLKGEFTLDDQVLQFPALTISGNVAEITGQGNYHLAQQQVDFRLRVNLLGSLIEQPSGFRRLRERINPFPGILEGDLTGPINNPQWRSAYDPRSWLFPQN